MTDYEEIRQKVNSLLESAGVTVTVNLGAELQVDEANDNWKHDLWIVWIEKKGTFSQPAAKNSKPMRVEYRTGIGHRISMRQRNADATRRKKELGIMLSARLPEGAMYKTVSAKHFCNEARDRKNRGQPVFSDDVQLIKVPSAADVIYSLLSDESCGSETFPDFCANLGYDTDSRRALDTYLKCQQIGQELRQIFTGQQVAELRELLQDY